MTKPRFGCSEVRDLAPELALGILAGDERADGLSHLGACADCRMLVDELSRTADALLLLAREEEPGLGFEDRVIGRMRAGGRRRVRRWLAAAALAAVVASAASAFLVHRAGDRERRLAREYAAVLETLGGTLLRAGILEASGGHDAGHVFLYDGEMPWLFVAVEDAGAGGEYEIELELAGGERVRMRGIRVRDGRGSWGGTAAVGTSRVRYVRLLDAAGEARYEASFRDAR